MTDHAETVREALTAGFDVRAEMKAPPSIAHAFAALTALEQENTRLREAAQRAINRYDRQPERDTGLAWAMASDLRDALTTPDQETP
jgi:hypothetical protein